MPKNLKGIIKYAFLVLLPVSFFLGLIFGEVWLTLDQLIHPNGVYSIIIYEIRLPTVISAMLIGALLALSGALLQHLLKNPLIDPFIAGTASGGELGAVIAFALPLIINFPLDDVVYLQPILAFITASLATFITLAIGRKGSIYGIVVGGVVVSFLFSSLTTIVVTILQQLQPRIPPITFWLLGEINIVGWRDVIILSILTLVFLTLTLRFSRTLDLLAISDEMSYAHKINPNRQRILWLLLVSLINAFIVSIAGIIGFVGIIVPHIARRIGGNIKSLAIYTTLIGAVLMEFSNIASRGLFGTIIPLTSITALLASPIIIWILVRMNANQGIEG